MIKNLFLMRHAKSSWAEAGQDDFDRPLNNRGLNDAPRMGEWVASQGCLPDLILVSAAKRTLETAELFAQGANYAGEIQKKQGLYLCRIDTFIDEISSLNSNPDSLLVIAHNPGTAAFITHLTGQYLEVTTANVAWIELHIDRWADLNRTVRGELREFWQPKKI